MIVWEAILFDKLMVQQGHDRVAPFLRLHASVRRLAPHVDGGPQRRLSRRDNIAVGARRFEREGYIRAARRLANQRQGATIVDFFVADAQKIDSSVAVEACRFERLQGDRGWRAAPPLMWHRTLARWMTLPSMDRGHVRLRCPPGEDRVGVAQKHHPPVRRRRHVWRGGCHPRWAGVSCLPVICSLFSKWCLQPVLHGIDARFVQGAGVDGW